MLLAGNLIAKIKSGAYPAGSLLPTESQLGEQFGVSRITVRGALRELETQGLVSRRPRLGSRVEASVPRVVFSQLGDSVDDLLEFTKGLPVQVLTYEELRQRK